MVKYEVVITSGLKKPNRAPIGVNFKENKVVFQLYYGSHTYSILNNEDYFVVNIVDPYYIAKSLITDEGNYNYVNLENNIKLPFLEESSKILIYKIIKRNITLRKDYYGKSKVLTIVGDMIHKKDIKNEPCMYSRSGGLLIEMAIIYSRKNLISSDLKDNYVKLLKDYLNIIKKTGDKHHINLAKYFLENF